MVEVKEVADGVYRLETPVYGAYYPPVVYIIRESAAVLLEPGPSAAVPSIQEAMRYLGVRDLAYIIPTHVHMDHAGGAGMLGGLYPGARVLVHPKGVKHALDPSGLVESAKLVLGDDF